jgi:alkanesulfonate monooxygenase SsuD/methylene tetrahydromethanopterin reductase-like flavin-dependent oxidoreductase (luciferase family)
VKLGLHLAATDWPGGPRQLRPKLAEIVQTAEAAGFDAISVVDHVWQHPYLGGPEQNEIEGYTTLGFIAAHTSRVRLLTLATCTTFRPAGLLAKMVTTLDVLSGGRMMLGIGAGDYAEEATGLGLPFPATGSGSTSLTRRFRPACGCGRAPGAQLNPSTASMSGWSDH